MSIIEHKKNAPRKIKLGIISVSSTRSLKNDKSGLWINNRALKEGHKVVFHHIIEDEIQAITENILDAIRSHEPQVILMTGGTGISSKDVTIEAVLPLFEKALTAFGPLFAQLSFEKIDSAVYYIAWPHLIISFNFSIYSHHTYIKPCQHADAKAPRIGLAWSIRAFLLGVCKAFHISLRLCKLSQKSGVLLNTFANIKAVSTVIDRLFVHISLTVLRLTPIALASRP